MRPLHFLCFKKANIFTGGGLFIYAAHALSAPALPKYISSQTAEFSVADSITLSCSSFSMVALPSKRR